MLPVSLIFTSGVASGVNSYAAVLVLGLLGRFGHIAAIPAVLERPSVLAAAGVLYVGQFVVGKVPVLDSVWDVVHTPLRPIVGGAIGVVMAQQAHASPAATIAGAVLGGGSALASHVVKTGTRLGVNASPEPFSNIAASLLEDLGVVGLVSFAVFHPVVAAIVAAVLLAAGLGAVRTAGLADPPGLAAPPRSSNAAVARKPRHGNSVAAALGRRQRVRWHWYQLVPEGPAAGSYRGISACSDSPARRKPAIVELISAPADLHQGAHPHGLAAHRSNDRQRRGPGDGARQRPRPGPARSAAMRLLRPVIAAAVIIPLFVSDPATRGNGLAVEIACVAAGLLGGLAAAALMRVYRSPKTGPPASSAGRGYAAFWTAGHRSEGGLLLRRRPLVHCLDRVLVPSSTRSRRWCSPTG